MLYLSEVYFDAVEYFDDSGTIFTDSIGNFFNNKEIYGRKEDDTYIAVPAVKKEWVLYSEKELHDFVKSNQVEILKFKLQGIVAGANLYLLPSKTGYTYYSFNGQGMVNNIHILLYNKANGKVTIDKFHQLSRLDYISLRHFKARSKKLQKSKEDFSMPTIFYRDGEWYLYINIADRYEIRLKDLLEK